MSPFSPLVLIGAALVSSPALWGVLVGRQDLSVGLGRYLVAVGLCWLGGSVLAMLVGPPAAAATPPATPSAEPSATPAGERAGRDDAGQPAPTAP